MQEDLMGGTRGPIEEDEEYVHSCIRLHSRSLDLNWRIDVNMADTAYEPRKTFLVLVLLPAENIFVS